MESNGVIETEKSEGEESEHQDVEHISPLRSKNESPSPNKNLPTSMEKLTPKVTQCRSSGRLIVKYDNIV